MYINTTKNWNDLHIGEKAKEELQKAGELIGQQQEQTERAHSFLFRGDRGAGKKTAASLLGTVAGKSVLHVDLNEIVSKYIGETEKNIDKILDRAESKHAILYFDEADALFGKRSEVQDSHDKYANQEVSYLLRKLEENNSVAIFATRPETKVDDSLLKHFKKVIHFVPRKD